jgi:FkbM family methyltransferase
MSKFRLLIKSLFKRTIMTNIISRYLRRKSDPIDLLVSLLGRKTNLRTLVHVGAHVGQERGHYEAAGFMKILWIEGSPTTHERLAVIMAAQNAQNEKAGRVARHETLCGLMTDSDGEMLTLKEYSNDGMSSSLFAPTETMRERWPDVKETGGGETVPSARLDTLLAMSATFGKPDLLVVDVQGAELMVLKGATETLKHAKAVICEVSSQPYYQGGVLYPELSVFLAKHGFEPQSVPRRHGDMLFLRSR